ncbi:TPA: DNAse, partial [Streptococcus pyogenes]
GVTTVILENSAPNINLDYLNGTATPKN